MSSYLDEVGTQLESLTERGAHRRWRALMVPPAGGDGRGPRRLADAIACAAVILVTVGVVVVVVSGHTAKPRPTSATRPAQHGSTPRHPRGGSHLERAKPGTAAVSPAVATTAGGPVPRGFAPRSFTAISELTWWLLGTAPCSRPPCTSIVRTTNGGRSFVGIPAPRTPLAQAGGRVGVSEVRFADSADGFAYSPDLYATHDGGATWHQIDVGGSVSDVAISAGEVYAVVAITGPGTTSRLLRSPVSRDAWTVLPAAGEVAGGLWVHGADLLIQSGNNGRLLVSHDFGASFSRYRVPSPGLPCQFQEMAPEVVWEHCATGMMSGVWRSPDGGASLQHVSDAQLPPQPNSAAFAAASARTAVVGYQQLYRTVDAGAAWTPVGPPGLNWVYLGFTDPTHGVGLATSRSSATGERLYYTTDAGASYHLVEVP